MARQTSTIEIKGYQFSSHHDDATSGAPIIDILSPAKAEIAKQRFLPVLEGGAVVKVEPLQIRPLTASEAAERDERRQLLAAGFRDHAALCAILTNADDQKSLTTALAPKSFPALIATVNLFAFRLTTFSDEKLPTLFPSPQHPTEVIVLGHPVAEALALTPS